MDMIDEPLEPNGRESQSLIDGWDDDEFDMGCLTEYGDHD